ncbi:MAG: hypothetical protein G5701_01705 [Serratia symbiotica]|nr:hypothetical protein [Serratia symbiotica]
MSYPVNLWIKRGKILFIVGGFNCTSSAQNDFITHGKVKSHVRSCYYRYFPQTKLTAATGGM